MPVLHFLKTCFVLVAIICISTPLLGQETDTIPETTAAEQSETQSEAALSEPVHNGEIKSDPLSGFLTVKGKPEGAEVLIDGEKIGESPVIETQLKNGIYEIKISRDGYKDYITEISVQKGIAAWIVYELDVVPYGYLSVEGTPDSSDVYLNNEKIGETPLINKKIPSGDYTVTVMKTGYETYESTCEIAGTEYKRMTYTIAPLVTHDKQKTPITNIPVEVRKTAIKKSLKLPGHGQRYLGHRKKGNIITAFQAVTLGGFIIAYRNASNAVDNYDDAKTVYRTTTDPTEIQIAWDKVKSKHDSAKTASTLSKVAFFGAFGVYVWNVIDAGFISKPAVSSIQKQSLIITPVISDDVSGIAASLRF